MPPCALAMGVAVQPVAPNPNREQTGVPITLKFEPGAMRLEVEHVARAVGADAAASLGGKTGRYEKRPAQLLRWCARACVGDWARAAGGGGGGSGLAADLCVVAHWR